MRRKTTSTKTPALSRRPFPPPSVATSKNLVTSNTAAVTTVTDTIDKTEVSISGSTSITEGQNASYTVSLTHPAQTEVTLKNRLQRHRCRRFGLHRRVHREKSRSAPAARASTSRRWTTSSPKAPRTSWSRSTRPLAVTSKNLAVSASNGSVSTSIIDNDAAPVLDLDANNSSGATGANYNVTFTEGTTGQGVSIGDTDLKITDPDSTMLTGATIVLTNRQPGDALNLGNSVNGISINANSQDGTVTLTLSGNATLADYMQQIKKTSASPTAVKIRAPCRGSSP